MSAGQDEVTKLREENASLRDQVAELLKRIEALEKQLQKPPEPPSFVKANRPKRTGTKGARKKRDPKHNTSRKRSKPTRSEKHAYEQCPECGHELRGESLSYSREVIELPPPSRIEVIEHRVIKRWCPGCKKWHAPKLDLEGQVFGQGRFGVRVATLIAYLRTTMRLTVKQIQAYLATIHQLTISTGQIERLSQQVGENLKPEMKALLSAVRESPVVHADETGWREDGQNGYIWALITEGAQAIRYFVYHKSRASAVIQGLLGLRIPGHVVSDFYASYNVLRGPQQRCWVHLLRALHDLKKHHEDDAAVLLWANRVKALYTDAHTWLSEHQDPSQQARQEQYDLLLRKLEPLGQLYALESKHPCQALAKRLLRYQDELFQFVLFPLVPADNNLAERALRPLVVIRKISGGSRSDFGSKTRLTLYSLFSTWRARNLNPFDQCLLLLQASRSS